MNILREVRRFNQKSMPLRIISILVFSVILIVTTYAWFSTQKDVKALGLRGNVTSWDVSYYINHETSEIIDHTATFVVEDFFPGMEETTDVVHIYNIGESSSNVKCELESVKLFGEEILTKNAQGKQVLNVYTEDAEGNKVLSRQVEVATQGNTTTVFAGDTAFPFKMSYTLEKDYLNGQYDPYDEVTSESAYATVILNVDWDYESQNESQDRDVLDTQFAKNAYAYYQQAGTDISKAIEVKVKIISSMIHPSLEAQ